MGEIDELKHNLRVSFSRMKEDINDNKSKIDQLIELNQQLTKELIELKNQLSGNKGLKSELMETYERNKKSIIKQRILNLINTREYSKAELKHVIVDQKDYCSKASFYRYINEMSEKDIIEEVSVNGEDLLVTRRSPSLQMF